MTLPSWPYQATMAQHRQDSRRIPVRVMPPSATDGYSVGRCKNRHCSVYKLLPPKNPSLSCSYSCYPAAVAVSPNQARSSGGCCWDSWAGARAIPIAATPHVIQFSCSSTPHRRRLAAPADHEGFNFSCPHRWISSIMSRDK